MVYFHPAPAPRPPLTESVKRALAEAKGMPGSAVRILTMEDNTQRVVVCWKSGGGASPLMYYDPELGQQGENCEARLYHLKVRLRVTASKPYSPGEYGDGLAAYVKRLAEGQAEYADVLAYQRELDKFKALSEWGNSKNKKIKIIK